MIYEPRNHVKRKNEDRALCRSVKPAHHTAVRVCVCVCVCMYHSENARDKFNPLPWFFARRRLGIYCFNLPWPCLIMESSFWPATACCQTIQADVSVYAILDETVFRDSFMGANNAHVLTLQLHYRGTSYGELRYFCSPDRRCPPLP